MTTFVLLSKVSPEGVRRLKRLSEMDQELDKKLAELCPQVKRVASYALLGAYDFLHIFEAPDAQTAAKVALIANSFGVSTSQTLTAIPIKEFAALAEKV